MSSLASQLASLSPLGWKLNALIFLDPEWQVNLRDDEHVVVATGATPEEAFTAAEQKIANHDYLGRLLSAPKYLEPAERQLDLLALIGKPKVPADFKRRV